MGAVHYGCQAAQFLKDLREDARGQLAFEPHDPREKLLQTAKAFLQRWTAALRALHTANVDVAEIGALRALTFDELNRALYALALKAAGFSKENAPAALVATGGYGRLEMSPFSDMDFMLLTCEKTTQSDIEKLHEAFTEKMLYPLWDLNLKVGHSVRTIAQAIDEADKDNFTKNALLETRLVDGDTRLFEDFKKAYRAYYETDIKGYLRARLDGAAERRARYGDTAFLQEPEIKNGVGGLRDYQNIIWMAQVALGEGSLKAAVKAGWLSEQNAETLAQAHRFLLKVRNEVHFETNRPVDILDLDRQSSVALALGYDEPDLFERNEHFMRDYYGHAQSTFLLASIAEQRIQRAWFPRKKTRAKGVSKDGFLIAEGFICAEDSEIFKKDPLQLLRVFELMQRHDAQLDVDLALLVYDSLELLDEASALSPAAQKILREILRRKGKVARALGAMHTCGVLSKVLPEFAKLTCLVQHEHYHRYTVDIHTLSTIAQLDKLFLDEVPYAEVYRQQLEKLRAPWILYPTLLLHDVGKAVGIKGHSHESVVIAEPVLTRLGLSAPERQLALFVIGHHMEMSRACLRYDVDDPLTAKAFARMVGDKEKLRALFIHTFCDSNGTSATLWNGYKQALHTRLFSATLQRLGSQGQPSKALEQAKARLSERLGASGQLADLSAEEIAAHFDLMPDGYFANAQDADVLRHLQMTHELFVQMSGASEKATLMPVLHWQHDKAAGLSHLDIVTWDRTGLFYRLAGALAASGINILGTRAHSRADCITIDTFTVCEAHGGAVLSEHTRARFEKALAQSLLEGEDLLPAIELQAEKISKTFFSREKPVRGKVKTKVSLHYEDALEQNILEVRANDRLGLLYTIAREISLSGFDISFARITTERGIALDTFYISPTDPDTPAPSKETLDALRERLTQTLEANK